MKTYSKKLLVAFFFSMLPMVLMSCSMDPEKASFSISNCTILLLIASSSAGNESISVLIIAPASSIRSIALSGKYLS